LGFGGSARVVAVLKKNYGFEESSVEKVKDKPVYLILSRESLRQEEVDPIVGKAHVDKGCIHVETSYPDFAVLRCRKNPGRRDLCSGKEGSLKPAAETASISWVLGGTVSPPSRRWNGI
jgi:hypothetical protein